jgi:hypothetical protein
VVDQMQKIFHKKLQQKYLSSQVSIDFDLLKCSGISSKGNNIQEDRNGKAK